MIYEYRCKFCQDPVEVVKGSNRIDIDERCKHCKINMKRIFNFQGRMGFGTFKEGYYDAFGKNFTQKHQLDNEIRRINGETGQDIQEVGNDSSVSKQVFKQPDIAAATQELRSKWRQ